MSGKLITVFGGSGFLGRYAVRSLCKAGWRVRVAVRNPMNAGDLRVGGEVGQVQIVQANVRNRPSVERALEGADAVLNLVGILYESGRQSFEGSQHLGAKNVAELAQAAGVSQMIHISAIGADENSKADYARTKAEGEKSVREYMPQAVILRPSIIFGPEDGFFNRFAGLAKMSPVLPLIGGGKTRFQPVFVGDVAEAILAALDNPSAQGRIFELGGPRSYSFKELLTYICEQTNRSPFLIPVPFFIAQIKGMAISLAFKMWPFHAPPLTGDQVRMLKTDNVVGLTGDDSIGTIEDLGVTELESVEAIVPSYLWPYRPYGQFQIRETADEVSRVDV
ncbi:MAG: complex I NDUFA9 subunit family protein [Hirschia sp.]|nr:complex I NDUFA9 subunit family protein [Hirschia sp.]MBF18968.1 complex I NDUFA9 subunit family protein [Hirschia sp.]